MKHRSSLPIILWGLAGPALIILLTVIVPAFGLDNTRQLLTRIDYITQDLRTRALGPAEADKKIAIFAVDDSSLDRYGRWPWPRSLHGRIIDRLDSLGAKAIVYDVMFFQRSDDPKEDEALLAAMKHSGKVVITMPPDLIADPRKSITDEQWEEVGPRLLTIDMDDADGNPLETYRLQPPPKEFIEAAAVLATNPATPDSDKAFRRMPVLVKIRDKVSTSLSLAALRPGGEWNFDGLEWEGDEIIVPSISKSKADLRIPVDNEGRMVINWTGQWGQGIRAVPAFYLLEPKLAPEDEAELKGLVSGSICFVGVSATGSTDIRPQPFQTAYPMVGLHADMANTILTGAFRTESGAGAAFFYLVVLGCIAMALGFVRQPWAAAGIAAAVLAAYVAYAFAALAWFHNYIPIAYPASAFIISTVGITYYRLQKQSSELREMREKFGPLLPPAVLDQLMEDPEAVRFTGERRELTVMFSDIKGFTGISDREAPEVIYQLLTEYFDAMTEIVFKHKGTIDKYIGDGIMAFWGAPLKGENPALSAVNAAVEMQAKTKELSVKWQAKGWPEIKIRIGINTGEVSVGFFGSHLHQEYTALGSAVNMAQRLESNCTPGNVMISTRTAELVKDRFEARKVGAILLKGFKEAVDVCEIDCEG